MAALGIPLKQVLSDDQLAFVEKSIRNSFHVDSVRQSSNALEISHPDSETPEAIEKMAKRFLFIAKSLDKDLVFENDVPIRYSGDPQPHLESTRDVIPVHPGFFTLQGDFLSVFHCLNRTVRAIAATLNAIEQEYPTVWPVRLFKKIDYFHEFPQQVILCASVKDDYPSRNAFSERYSKDKDFDSVPMDSLMQSSEYGLEPAVCDCCYYGLEGMQDLEDAFYTCYNKVFRNERSQSGRLDRLTNFSVRDIMFVGSREFVLESRQRLIDRLSELIVDLQLRAKIETATDPFFANDAAMKSVFQTSHRLKYELLATIPHLGRDIAVGSVNFHMDFFGNAFDIRSSSGTPAFSGCIGIGMERMTYALFCQHGESICEWPDAVLDFLGLSEEDRVGGQ